MNIIILNIIIMRIIISIRSVIRQSKRMSERGSELRMITIKKAKMWKDWS